MTPAPPGTDLNPGPVTGGGPAPTSRPGTPTDSPRTSGVLGPDGFLRRFARNRLAVLGSLWLLFLLVCFLVPGLVATHDPHQQDVTLIRLLEGPSGDHWLGTDGLGSDLFSRVVWGGRLAVGSILIGLGLSASIGIPLGLVSGWIGGWFDRIVMWIVDVLFSLPLVLLAMAIVAVAGTGMVPAMVAVGLLLSTRFARLTRSVTLAEREELYVDAARITGLSSRTILGRYIMPNLLPALIVQVAVISGAILLIGAVLSFIGVGSEPTGYDWGAMLNQARGDFLLKPWQIVPAAAAIVITVLSFNLVGDAIRDAVGRDASTSALARVRTGTVPVGPTPHAPEALLSIRDLSVSFPTRGGSDQQILDGVSIDVGRGETLGLVGESGSGKSMTLLAALGLVPAPGRVTAGSVWFDGQEVINLTERQWRGIRGGEIGMVFQEPVAVLNPALTIGDHLLEPLRLHTDLGRGAARRRALELLALVKVPDPARRFDEYPHQMSGGMAQRVGIALALACEPKLLIADEPTTALDVTVQGQILDLLADLRSSLGMTLVIVTHDLGVVAEVADRVAVLYAGQVVEEASANDLFAQPHHPYTRALLETMPQNHRGGDELSVIPGMVPSASAWPAGCRFHPRCDHAVEVCRTGHPVLLEIRPGRQSRCVRTDELVPATAGRPDRLDGQAADGGTDRPEDVTP